LDEWNKAKRKGRTLAAVAAKSPVKKSKWARITKAVLKECAELRAKNVSWQTICDTLREYDPVQLKTKGMAFIAKSSL
jgi:hypothetical protein